MHIAVCDDNGQERGLLLAQLQKELDARSIKADVVSFASGDALLEAMRTLHFQVYFLDIYMQGISGVQVARRIRAVNKHAAIVFTTSSPDHMAEGFDVGAAHYLVKPFAREDVGRALERCLRSVGYTGRYVALSVNRQPRRVMLSAICYAESQDKYCVLHTQDGPLRVLARLDEIEARLDDERFLRCHRSYLVNMDAVTGGADSGAFILRDGTTIPIRREGKASVRARFEDYTFKKIRGRL